MNLSHRIKRLERFFPPPSKLDIESERIFREGLDIDEMPGTEIERIYSIGMEELGWPNIDKMSAEEIQNLNERLQKNLIK